MRPRHVLEYIGLRAGLFLADIVPLAAASAAARAAADLFYLLAPARRRIARDNVLRAGIVPDAREAGRIARASMRHFGVLAIESLRAGPFFAGEQWRRNVTLDIPPATRRLFEDPDQGVILASGHLGNWEIGAQILSTFKPVIGVARPMNNPYTEELVRRRGGQHRLQTLPKHGASANRLLDVLKGGHGLALLIDQHARNRAVTVDFFGAPAATHTSPAVLHLFTGAPLCFAYCRRTGPMCFTFKADEPIVYKRSGDRKADVKVIMQDLTRRLEDAVRSCPDQYLWAHRRWRNPGPDRAGPATGPVPARP